MIRPILKQHDENATVLRTPCVEVVAFDKSLWDLIADMWDSMYAAPGIGLAATQIGSNLRVAVIDTLRRPSSNRLLVLVNPEIESFSGEETAPEGCLSMPGRYWNIPRASLVSVTFQGLNGAQRSLETCGLLARCIQHECDHLDGILCNSKAISEVGATA